MPEPNFCVLVPDHTETVIESFIHTGIKKRDAESAALMRNLVKSRGIDNIEVVISNDNPLLTAIPARARKTKRGKSNIKFSDQCLLGVSVTETKYENGGRHG